MDQRKISCIVVDDEPPAGKLLQEYISKTEALTLNGVYNNPSDALAVISKEKPDLLFLDIQMPGLTGINLLKKLEYSPAVIFTTAYEEFAIEGFRLDVADYLLKPFSYEEFLKGVEKAKRMLQLREASNDSDERVLTVRADYRTYRIPYSTITFIEGVKDYVKIHTTDRDRALMSLLSLKHLEEVLPENLFMRIHRSFIVNLKFVNISDKSGVFIGNRKIPLSDKYRKKFRQFISGDQRGEGN